MKIGIVITAFNSEKTIYKTLDSVKKLKKEKYVDIFCVVVDDKSKDNTNLIIEDYVQKKIVDVYIKNKKNLGVSETRNIGIQKCRNTDFITFLDDDDEIIHSFFSKLDYKINSDLIFCDYYIKKGLSRRLIKHLISNDKETGLISKLEFLKYIKKYLLNPNLEHLFVSSWGKLFSTSIIFKNKILFNKKMSQFEDIEFNFKFMMYAHKLKYINKALYLHNISLGIDVLDSATMGKNGNVYDMFSFTHALRYLNLYLKKIDPKKNYDQLLSHCKFVYSVIYLIRTSLRIRSIFSFCKVLKDIRKIFKKNNFAKSFVFHQQLKGHKSFMIPFLIRKELFFLALIFAFIEGRKKYFK